MKDPGRPGGFEDDWRQRLHPGRTTPQTLKRPRVDFILPPARLARLVAGAREVLFTVTGAIHSRPQLVRHLDYITRKGSLQLEDQDGFRLEGRKALMELADDWDGVRKADSLARPDSPIGRTTVFSMPPGTDPQALEGAVREAAVRQWRERFEFAWVRHADTDHPHVHLVICALGAEGARYTPDRADLRHTREAFSEALRDRGVAAEATSRVSRGITRKAEPIAIRKMREQYERGEGPMPRTLEAAYLEAADAAFDPTDPVRPWELRIVQTQSNLRGLYLRQADLLARSADPGERRLAQGLQTFVAAMPPPDTRRLEMARKLRELAELLKVRAEHHRALLR